MGEFDAAIDAQQVKIRLLREMPGFDKNRRAQQLLANAGYEIGRLQLMLGRYALAARTAQDALDQTAALVAMDGSNTEWLAHMIFARLSLAEVELALGRPDAARSNLGRAAGDTAKLLSTDSTRNK